MKIVIGTSRWQHVILLLVSLAFVAAGIFILVSPAAKGQSPRRQHLVGWSGIILFGGCALTAAWQLIDARPRLIIDDEGIFDRTLRVGRIPWSDIQGAYLRSIANNDFICLELRDSERYLGQTTAIKRALAKANTTLGFTPISLNLSGVAADSKDVLELILKRIHERTENA